MAMFRIHVKFLGCIRVGGFNPLENVSKIRPFSEGWKYKVNFSTANWFAFFFLAGPHEQKI